MFPQWLKPNSSNKADEKTGSLRHVVLSTPLKAPLMSNQEEILFACGCFWGAEKGFWKLPGVVVTAVGYAGGHIENPTYNQVCSGQTGHTEVVRVTWNIEEIDLSDLLKLFWECHDPTQGNRQGNDRGSQYRSAIYTFSDRQTELSNASLDAYQMKLTTKDFGTITTEVKPNQTFYYAENYHQQYLAKPGSRPYCSAMPTKVELEDFPGASYKLDRKIWSHFDWTISHCVLRSNNNPIK